MLRQALRLIATFALATLAACVQSGEPAALPFELAKNDILIIARAAGDQDNAQALDVTHAVANGREISIPLSVSEDHLLLVYHLRYEDLRRASGDLTDSELRALKVRLVGDRSDFENGLASCTTALGICEGQCSDLTCKSGCRVLAEECREKNKSAAGSCGRCLVPATSAPQIVNDGDSCSVPMFADARVFRESGGKLSISDRGTDVAVLEAQRASIRIDWTNVCSCADEASEQSFTNLTIEPISPPESPWAFEHFAENEAGIVAGARDRAAVVFDRVNPPNIITFPDVGADTRSLVALSNGNFLMAGEKYNAMIGDGYLFHLFRYRDGALSPPEDVGGALLARPGRMKYLGTNPDTWLYLLGSTPGRLVQAEAGIFACDEEPFSCTKVSIDHCPGDAQSLYVSDAVMLPNGVGVGIAFRGLYLKAPGPAAPDPSPSDLWTCSEFSPDPLYQNTRGESIRLNGLRALGQIGNRAFVCSVRNNPPCEPYYPVVLSAVLTATTTEPDWKIVAEGDNYTDCRAFFHIPNEPDRVRVLLSNSRTIDFNGAGAEVARGNISELFDSGVRWNAIAQLQTGNLLARTRYNGAYISGGVSKFERLYGPSEFHDGNYDTLIPLKSGGFVAFGTNREITRIRPEVTTGPKVSFLADRNGSYRSTDIIRDAVLDTASTNAQQTVILAVGYTNTNPIAPLVRRYFLNPDATEIVTAEDVPVDPEFFRTTPRGAVEQLAVDGVTEVAPGQFVAYTQDTRLLRIEGSNFAREIPMNWDAVDSDTVEMRPTVGADQCNPNAEPRLDAFRDIDGKGGVAWAVGANGLVVRVVGDSVDRFLPRVLSGSDFQIASGAELRTVRASCPDRAMVAGSYELPGDDLGRTFRAFSVGPQPERGECFPSSTGQEGSSFGVFELADSAECVSFPATQAIYQIPNVILPTSAGAAVIINDGSVVLAGGSFQGARLKVPFSVLSSFADGLGNVLFGGFEGRLAIGTSR